MRCIVFTLCSQCQALGQALILCRQGRGDLVGCVVLLFAPPASPLGCGSSPQRRDDALHRFHPLIPVSGTGTGFDPLPSRERGFGRLVLACCCPARLTSGLRIKSATTWCRARPVDTALKPVRACATVVASSYSAWRVSRPVDSRLRGNDGPVHRPSGLRIKSAMTWWSCPRCGYCLEASMTVRDAGDEDRVIVCGWVLRFPERQRSWGLVRSEIVLLCELGFATRMRR